MTFAQNGQFLTTMPSEIKANWVHGVDNQTTKTRLKCGTPLILIPHLVIIVIQMSKRLLINVTTWPHTYSVEE